MAQTQSSRASTNSQADRDDHGILWPVLILVPVTFIAIIVGIYVVM
jgi:hypothetical protein